MQIQRLTGLSYEVSERRSSVMYENEIERGWKNDQKVQYSGLVRQEGTNMRDMNGKEAASIEMKACLFLVL